MSMQQRMLAGLIGANIQKSLAPALFEDACAAAGILGHYHLMDLDTLPGRSLSDLLAAAKAVGFAGFNVTYPCKQAVLELLDGVSEEARQIGAVNTVVIDGTGATCGHNTDRIGFFRAFEEAFGCEAARGKTALLVGAGGAGRAVAYALFDAGLETLLVHDIDIGQAQRLVASLVADLGSDRARVVTDQAAALAQAAGVVNATPVGMHRIPGDPVAVSAITAKHWVADVIYTPLETALVLAARAKGARAMGGAGMCVHQAAETFRLFTGHAPDVARMQRVFATKAVERDGG